jgi:MFS family permease
MGSIENVMHKKPHRSLVAAALFTTLFFVFGGCYTIFGLFFMPLVREFGATHTSVALLSTLILVMSGLTGPLAGWLLKRIGAKLVMGVGAAVAGLALIGISYSHTFTHLYIWYSVLGIGIGASTWLTASIVVTNWFKERPATALGFITMGWDLGGMLLALLAAYEIQHSGWRIAYLFLAAPIFLIVVPVVFLFVQTTPEGPTSLPGDTGTIDDSLDLSTAMRTSSFWLAGLALFCYGVGAIGSFVHLVPHLLRLGYSEKTAAFALSATIAIIAVGKPTMGVLGDRFGARPMLAAGWAIFGFSTFLLVDARSSGILVPALLFYGLTIGTSVALFPIVLAKAFGVTSLGQLLGWLFMFQTVGFAVGPVLLGKLYDLQGNYTEGYAICGMAVMIAACSILGCVRRDPVDSALHAGFAAPKSE